MDATLSECPVVHVPREIMAAVVRVESARNPFAIGVVGGRLVRQPANKEEALATLRDLESRGYNYSVGMAQVNRSNFQKYGINKASLVFDACANIEAGSKILQECYSRSKGNWGSAFSCYYSGNFVTGYKHGYVQKVAQAYVAADNASESLVANKAGPQAGNTAKRRSAAAVKEGWAAPAKGLLQSNALEVRNSKFRATSGASDSAEAEHDSAQVF